MYKRQALFHHDAFDEPPEDRQRGVLFAQLAGRTAWLALSIGDLAERVREFGEALAAGELPWVAGALDDPEQLVPLLADGAGLLRELALPGCGRLAGLVNQGPDFTCLLADAGHAFVLEPGDALLLPNHGYARTAMHSVFCASDGLTYGLSFALRRDGAQGLC